MPILNDIQLNTMLINDFESIVTEVTEQLYKKLRQSIQEEVYNAGTPDPVDGYKRNMDNGGLLGSFYKENTKVEGQIIEGEINQDPMSMVHDPDSFTHGSNVWDGGDDVRDILADIVRAGMDNTIHPHVGTYFGFGFWSLPRDFWTPIENMLTNGELDQMIEKAMTIRGINWIKI